MQDNSNISVVFFGVDKVQFESPKELKRFSFVADRIEERGRFLWRNPEVTYFRYCNWCQSGCIVTRVFMATLEFLGLQREVDLTFSSSHDLPVTLGYMESLAVTVSKDMVVRLQ